MYKRQVQSIHNDQDLWVVHTQNQEYKARHIISCGGLHSDTIARMTDQKFDLKTIPFRGEYYTLKPAAHHLVKTLIYPIPNPNFPFLGVHFTSMIGGGVEAVSYTHLDVYKRQLYYFYFDDILLHFETTIQVILEVQPC